MLFRKRDTSRGVETQGKRSTRKRRLAKKIVDHGDKRSENKKKKKRPPCTIYELYVIRFQQPCGLQHSATTCCPRYPPGSTVLECRLEGDQPVAHVVQVPADRSPATQKMCLLVEARQSPCGPLSRVISRPQEDPGERNEPFPPPQTSRRPASPPMIYHLESCECPEGPIAMASTVPTDCSNIITTLETMKYEKDVCGPTSRIQYCPAEEKIIPECPSEQNPRDLPITIIDCVASSRETSARVARVSSDNENIRKNYFETRVPRDGGCPTALGFQCQSENTISCQQNVLETRIDECGPRTCLISDPRDHGRYCNYMESKSSCNGPSARFNQKPIELVCEEHCPQRRIEEKKINRPPPDCVAKCTCPKTNQKRSVVCDGETTLERRNGLDPSENLPSNPFKRSPKKRVRPNRCCPLLEDDQRRQNECVRDETIKSVTLPEAMSRKSIDDQCKMDQQVGDDCMKSEMVRTVVRKGSKMSLKESSKCSTSFVPKIKSEELLTRYRDHIPPNLLNRFEACRSKRNGLQDDCYLPVPRAVIELKKKTVCRGDDQRGSEKGDVSVDYPPTPYVSLTSMDTQSAKQQKQRKKTIVPEKSESKTQKLTTVRKKNVPLKRVKSRELYSGSVYIDCDCYHRNGLQHDCPRTSCGGPPCRVKPWPECDLGTYFMEKWEKYYDHLDTVPPTSFCGPKETWLAILKEERMKQERNKCHEKEVAVSSGTETSKNAVKIAELEKQEDNVSECSERPDGIVKEYVMIPIKATCKEKKRC
ncbi:hypothetical protein WN55_03477 [Dufourea novaeangliae]|uniref:Uncharacterized protein n=1 Tax=Dufourea novaeangliae TaxID=178035 RepID=A0A154PJI1_DUFNO|nr:hypothetical protein WN55_03477 [Dufourea novaeangliae]